jgi:ferritin-like metal-binding protein YciE
VPPLHLESQSVARAAARGLVAAMAMTGMRRVSKGLGLLEEAPPEAIAGRRARRLLRGLSNEQRDVAIELAHWGYGTAGGAAFGLLPKPVRRHPAAGPAYGLGVWLFFELVLEPVLGLGLPNRRKIVTRAMLVTDHVFYGVLVAGVPERERERFVSTREKGVRMGRVEQPRDLFKEKLGEMLYVERTLAEDVLPELRDEVDSAELRDGFAQHLEETRGHLSNLERVAEMLGLDAEEKTSHALDGMIKEHEEGVKDIERAQLRDLFDAGAAATTEHYEISYYESLVSMAETMGEEEAANLLRENLEQEQQTLKKLESASQKLTKEVVGR